MHFSTTRSARNATIIVTIIITTSIHIGVIASMVSPYAFPISAAWSAISSARFVHITIVRPNRIKALHVSIEWLKGETDEYETDITDKKELLIRDAMGDILKQLPLDLNKTEDAFSKDLLLLMLKQYELFLDSFQFACKNYKGSTKDADIAKVMGFESKDEYNEIMFLREITHTVNAFNDMADVVRLYSKKPEAAEQRLANLLSEVMYEDSESV